MPFFRGSVVKIVYRKSKFFDSLIVKHFHGLPQTPGSLFWKEATGLTASVPQRAGRDRRLKHVVETPKLSGSRRRTSPLIT